jgi:hypothetical protein
MAVTMRESWTDERLDDFATNVDRRFDRVEADLRELRTEMNLRFDSMQRTMIIGFAGIVASIVGSALAAILTTAH